MKNAAILLTMLACGLCAAQEATPAPSPAPQPAPQAQPSESGMYRDARTRQVLTHVTIDGVKALMMLDTGASHTVLSKRFVDTKLPNAQKIDTSGMQFNSQGSRQRPDLYFVKLDTGAKAGEKTVFEQPVLCLQLDGVQGSMATPIDGILGMDILGWLPFTFDLRNGDNCHWGLPEDVDSMVPMEPLQVDQMQRPHMQVDTGTPEKPHPAVLLLDTGSSVTYMPAEAWGMGALDAKATVGVSDVNGGRYMNVGLGKPKALALGKGVQTHPLTPQLQPGQNGVIGMDALKGLRFVHNPQRKDPARFFLISK